MLKFKMLCVLIQNMKGKAEQLVGVGPSLYVISSESQSGASILVT